MTLTREQFDQLIGTYADQVVDGMDMKSLVQFAYDTIVENLQDIGDEALLEQLCSYYEEEDVYDLLESVGANPADYDIKTNGDELTEDQQQLLRDIVKQQST
jgi:transcriptional regulator of aromatic amino acid metabolism